MSNHGIYWIYSLLKSNKKIFYSKTCKCLDIETSDAVSNVNIDADDIEDDDDDESWDEIEDDDGAQDEPTKCLFCDKVDSSIENSIKHLDQQHAINLNAVKKKFNLDQFSYIKVDDRLNSF